VSEMTFNQWKTLTMHKLISLAKKYRDDRKKSTTLNALIVKLHHLRSRDLATFLSLLYHASIDVPEVLDLIPSQRQIEKFFEEGE